MTDWPTVFVTGAVTIPSADLSLDDVATQTATVSSDVVVHGGEAAGPQRPLDVRANIALELPAWGERYGVVFTEEERDGICDGAARAAFSNIDFDARVTSPRGD